MRGALPLAGALLLAATACVRTAPPAAAPRAASTVRGTFRTAAGARDYRLHRPATSGTARAAEGALVVMLHGCTQDADDAARSTRLDDWADRLGFAVLYPEQPASANPKKCWSWYDPALMARDAGEVGLVAALVDSVARTLGTPRSRIALVGMSAGAAMAAHLAIAYPERYAALVMHSGVPALSAHDVATAVGVMQRASDAGALGRATHAAMGARARALPVLLVQGEADAVVNPANVDTIARQWALANALAAGQAAPRRMEDAATRIPALAGYSMTGRRIADDTGGTSVEWWRVARLGHAWSGGSAQGTYTNPAGPDATALAMDFLLEVWGGVEPVRAIELSAASCRRLSAVSQSRRRGAAVSCPAAATSS